MRIEYARYYFKISLLRSPPKQQPKQPNSPIVTSSIRLAALVTVVYGPVLKAPSTLYTTPQHPGSILAVCPEPSILLRLTRVCMVFYAYRVETGKTTHRLGRFAETFSKTCLKP